MRKELSLYLHIPFCKSKCHYCNFVSIVAGEEKMKRYIDSLKKEIEFRAKTYGAKYDIATIYIGGGTPSLLPEGQIKTLLKTIYTNFNVRGNAEITIEINPDSLTRGKVDEYLACGINRFSLGLQSSKENLLHLMGRVHTFETYKSSIQLLRDRGATNISTDVIIGLPTQTIEDVDQTIKELTNLQIPHISCYMLSIEEGTNFDKLVRNKKLILPSESEVIKQYNKVYKTLDKKGYIRYEISNFALPGSRSRHNQVYWDRKPYLGFGVASHSYIDETRLANTENVDEYIMYIEKNEIPLLMKEKLTKEDKMDETILLGLRTINGIDTISYEKEFGVSLLAEKKEVIKELIKDKFLILDADSRLKVTDKGFMVLNRIIEMLI